MLPSASLGDGGRPYEPIHGSAPTLAGKTSPTRSAPFGSVALMLRHAFWLEAEARAIESAIEAVLEAGLRTADIALPGEATVSCSAMGSAIADRIR